MRVCARLLHVRACVCTWGAAGAAFLRVCTASSTATSRRPVRRATRLPSKGSSPGARKPSAGASPGKGKGSLVNRRAPQKRA
jgi:hypothetical protein